MRPDPIDQRTAHGLLSGALAPEDAPPGYAGVAGLLQAAGRASTPDELSRSTDTVAAMAAAAAAGAEAPVARAGRRAGLTRLLRPRIAATLTAGALVLFGGLASAGALPGPLQHAAHVMLGAVGIRVPDVHVSGPSAGSSVGSSMGSPGGVPPGASTGPPGRSELLARAEGAAGGAHRPRGEVPRSHGARSGASLAASSAPGSPSAKPGATGSGPALSRSASETARGLCTAWARGGRRKRGEAFRRLRAQARANGDSVAEFCEQPQ